VFNFDETQSVITYTPTLYTGPTIPGAEDISGFKQMLQLSIGWKDAEDVSMTVLKKVCRK
jgi:hypothetical protein